MTSFDLTQNPWITAERLDGSVVELSTRDVLRSAHTLRALVDPSPLVVAAVTRHLLAVLHRAYDGPRTARAWCDIVASGRFEGARTDAYLDRVASRMDLFHPTAPFAQTRGLAGKFAKYVFDIDELEVTRSRWGLGRSLFCHRPEGHSPTMSPGRAARSLLAHHAFVTGGWVKKPGEPDAASDGPLTRVAVVFVRGETLFRTLAYNLLRYDPDMAKPFSTGGAVDACAWEQAPPPLDLPVPKEPKRALLGYLDLLTWQSRRVELVHDGSRVTGFINAVWQGVEPGGPRDPMVTWARNEEKGWSPLAIRVDRSFWREANALFERARGDAAYERPKAVDLIASQEARDVLGEDLAVDVEVVGLHSDKSLLEAVRCERVGTLARCFDDDASAAAVKGAIDRAGACVGALRSALWTYARAALAPGGRDPDKAAVSALVKSFGADTAAWSALGVAFDGLLRGLAVDPDAAARDFDAAARLVAREVFRSATARPDGAARWLKARALAERSLDQSLAPRNNPAALPQKEA